LFVSEAGFDAGIALAQACHAEVLHNTIVSTQAPFSSIEWRFDHTLAEITNNLVSHNLRERGGQAELLGNLEGAPPTLFVDATGGDLHLRADAGAAIDQGSSLPSGACDEDIDGDARPSAGGYDIGADEFIQPYPASVDDLRIIQAVASSSTLTITLEWTPPAATVTTTLRYDGERITEASWLNAPVLGGELPPGTDSYTAHLPSPLGTVFFALKTHSEAGIESRLSNNAFWPEIRTWMPLIHR
jgi:hypothetical protein